MVDRTFYIVTARAKHGRVTYHCPTSEWALRKVRAFHASEYTDIAITAPDGQPMREAALTDLVEGSGSQPASGAPVQLDVPSCPALAA